MRNAPRAPILKRIIALDEQRFVGPLGVLEVPAVIGVRLDRVRLPLPVWIDQLGGDQIAIGYGMRVGKGEGISEDGFDWAPDLWPEVGKSIANLAVNEGRGGDLR